GRVLPDLINHAADNRLPFHQLSSARAAPPRRQCRLGCGRGARGDMPPRANAAAAAAAKVVQQPLPPFGFDPPAGRATGFGGLLAPAAPMLFLFQLELLPEVFDRLIAVVANWPLAVRTGPVVFFLVVMVPARDERDVDFLVSTAMIRTPKRLIE